MGESEEITRETFWRCQDGRYVPIKDMEDSHLLRTIRVLRGMSPIGTTFKTDSVRRRNWLNAMANEAYSRGLELDGIRESDPVHE
jgi:hypothetical protein